MELKVKNIKPLLSQIPRKLWGPGNSDMLKNALLDTGLYKLMTKVFPNHLAMQMLLCWKFSEKTALYHQHCLSQSPITHIIHEHHDYIIYISPIL